MTHVFSEIRDFVHITCLVSEFDTNVVHMSVRDTKLAETRESLGGRQKFRRTYRIFRLATGKSLI